MKNLSVQQVCPVDCCVPDEDHVESEEALLNKKHSYGE